MKTMRLIASSLAVCLFAAWILPAQQVALEADSTADGEVPAVRSAPRLLKFSGVLTDDAGKPLKGPVSLQFSLYQDQEGGMPLWQEVQTVHPDSLGHYSVLLGATESAGLPLEPFASGDAHWLGVQVQGQAERSRTLLVSVPYAMRAEEADTLGGRAPSDFVLQSDLADEIRQLIESGAITKATAGQSNSVASPSAAFVPLVPAGVSSPTFAPGQSSSSGSSGQSGSPSSAVVASLPTSQPAQANAAVESPKTDSVPVGPVGGAESAGGWQEDFGTAQLHNGVAIVALMPSFLDRASVRQGYHVYLTADGDSRGLYVAQKTADGFQVREHGGGKSNISFDYRIVAPPRTR